MDKVMKFPPVKSQHINKLAGESMHKKLRAQVDDAIRRVEAAKARERQARLERKVVDDFNKRRNAQLTKEQS